MYNLNLIHNDGLAGRLFLVAVFFYNILSIKISETYHDQQEGNVPPPRHCVP